jgi:hypothetical protein
MRVLGTLLALTSSLALSACAHAKIPQTDIDDTPDNHQILDIVEAYQKAFEARDADAILAMVSHRYYEENGNTDRSDDYDFNGLRQFLIDEFQRTKAAQLDVRVDEIQVDEDNGTAFATLYYNYRAQSEFPVGLKWKTGTDFTRLRFIREDGRWKIVAGL